MTDQDTLQKFTGCLLGGAIGDALGAPIQFMSNDQIRSEFGKNGLVGYSQVCGRIGAITDETQMTLFTSEGLILSNVRHNYQGDDGIITAVYHALLRWLYTQESAIQNNLINHHGTCSIVDGVLTGYKELFSVRAPEDTCLSALKSGLMGTDIAPVNNSNGYACVSRMAPVGLVLDDAQKAFYIGCRLAALTHGHPTGILSTGTFAALISLLISNRTLPEAIKEASIILKSYENHNETLQAITDATEFATSHPEDPDIIEKIGTGEMAHHALAIGLYCSLSAKKDFKKGLVLAVNHSGKSDTTGSITGNLLGAFLDFDALFHLLADLELKELIEELAVDLFVQFKKE